MLAIGQRKILVEITDTDDTTYFMKCPIGKDGKIQINPKGGRGKENPDPPKTYFYKKGFLGLGVKRFARYRLLTKRFMTREDDDLPPISYQAIQDLINHAEYNAHFSDKQGNIYFYIIIAMAALQFFATVILPRLG